MNHFGIFRLSLFLFLVACTSSDTPATSQQLQNSQVAKFFSSEVETFEVKVLYEEGAEPYVGEFTLKSLGLTMPIWQITQQNTEALFINDPGREYIIPEKLEDMTKFSNTGQQTWTNNDLLNLAIQHGGAEFQIQTHGILVIYVDGFHEDGTSILGLQLTGYPFVYVFKPAIENISLIPLVRKFSEQAVVVHEIGHAVGFVNNGLPLTSAHEDEEHKGHCVNDSCVMYWANEGGADLIEFVQNFEDRDDIILFGDACLQDAWNY